jgi:acetolactate synthase I/II/III large subunit
MQKLSDYVMEYIAAQGVRDVFMLPGGGCMHLVDALGRSRQLSYVCVLHEQAAAIAAEAYAQYTNRLGVALVTTGPGGTNAVTGVAAAYLDSTPMLVLSGQVKRADLAAGRGVRQMGFQEIDIVAMVRPITKYAVTVMDAADIRFELEKACHIARSGRPGPVWVDIPLDIQGALIEPAALRTYQARETSESPSPQAIAHTIELLNHAERPVLLAGNGIRLADGLSEFEALVELLQVPVLTTWKAIDFIGDEHPLFAGRPGSVGQRGANFAQQNSDFLLSLGARLDLGQTGYDHAAFAREASKVVVDIDAAELRKLRMQVDVAAACDVRVFMRNLLDQRARIERRDRSTWQGRCRDWRKRYPVVLPEYWSERPKVNQYVLIDALSDAMRADDVLIPGSSGACSEATMQAFRVKPGMRIFNSEGLGPMGFGLPAAIGGCIASGHRRTVCVDGDGGFVMNVQELETLRRLGLPVKIFVLNNAGYASIRSTQQRYFDGRLVASGEQSGLTLPDVKRVASAFGVRTLAIQEPHEVRAGVAEALSGNDPVIVEVLVPVTQETRPRLMSRQRADGSFVSKPLEDLYPFLDREEFLANMLIPVAPEAVD